MLADECSWGKVVHEVVEHIIKCRAAEPVGPQFTGTDLLAIIAPIVTVRPIVNDANRTIVTPCQGTRRGLTLLAAPWRGCYIGTVRYLWPAMATTIQLSPQTRDKLTRLKSTPRETYDEVLSKLLALVPEGDEEGLYTQPFRVGLLSARLDLKEGRVVDHERVKRRLGL